MKMGDTAVSLPQCFVSLPQSELWSLLCHHPWLMLHFQEAEHPSSWDLWLPKRGFHSSPLQDSIIMDLASLVLSPGSQCRVSITDCSWMDLTPVCHTDTAQLFLTCLAPSWAAVWLSCSSPDAHHIWLGFAASVQHQNGSGADRSHEGAVISQVPFHPVCAAKTLTNAHWSASELPFLSIWILEAFSL